MVPPDRIIGRTLGHYRLIAQIGAGGMGNVYRARDERLERDVAVKVLAPGVLADEKARYRFRKEALALSRLNHPNIAVVHDFDTQDGVDFLVTELVAGVTLDDKVAAGPLPEKEVLQIGLQLVDGLQAAHLQGVIHRDLKPANLRLTPEGRLKILDFGLAKRVDPADELSVTQTFVEAGPAGTFAYMAPEQLRCDKLDARSDIWAAGVVLYELATGQPPFRGKTATVLADEILHAPPRFPQKLQPAMSARLTEIILKCLEKEAENRYQSAKELAVDLRRMTSPPTALAVATPGTWRRATKPASYAGMALVLLAAVLAATNLGGWRERLLRSASPPHIESLAVLPLENLSHDTEQEYFADGMTEALITDLAQISALKVISHTSVTHYKGTRKTLPEIARELNADAIVEGSVQRSGDRVRVTVQLVNAAADKHLWADRYERDLRDVLALQDDVASDVVKQIEKRLGGPKASAPPRAATVSPEAYETYLKGNYYLDNFELQKSIEYYNQAIKLDPNYAPAYAHMAQAYSFLAFFGEIPPNEGWGRVKEAATVAVQKDARLAAGYAALALAKLHFDWDFTGAEREFRRALELNPSDADNHHEYAHYLMAMGRVAESEAESQRAVELDPTGEGLNSCLCWHSFAARDYDQAVRLAQKFLRSQPNDQWEHTILGWTYEQKGMPDRAIVEFSRAVEITKGEPFFFAALGHAYALAGNRREAEKVLRTLSDRANNTYVSPFDLALIHAALGERDKAFALLHHAVAEHSTFLVYSKWEPRLDPLRSDPRFNEILKQIGLPA
jgi:serine/threonine protein kinase/Flp pilus assembly protein TadD